MGKKLTLTTPTNYDLNGLPTNAERNRSVRKKERIFFSFCFTPLQTETKYTISLSFPTVSEVTTFASQLRLLIENCNVDFVVFCKKKILNFLSTVLSVDKLNDAAKAQRETVIKIRLQTCFDYDYQSNTSVRKLRAIFFFVS